MKRTPLHAVHTAQSARMAEFQGWSLPAQFSDPSDEHHAVRTAAGLFDAGFLGRIEIAGPGALDLLQSLFTRDISKLHDGTASVGLFCDEQGRIIDLSILFRMPASGKNGPRFLVTSSPCAADALLTWMRGRAKKSAQVMDRTPETGQLALQGPHAESVLRAAVGPSFKDLKNRRLRAMRIADTMVTVSRTGYTGERGYEIFGPAESMPGLWSALIAAGKGYGLLPCGMICRNMLRLEAGYVQACTDISGERTPLEAGLMQVVEMNKDFVGRPALAELKTKDIQEMLVGFELFDKGIPRQGATIFSESREIGVATSADHSPHRRRDIGLGYVAKRYAQPGQEIEVEVKDREISAKIVELPFYRRKA